LRDDLSRRPLTEIIEFRLRLDQVTGQASTWELAAAMQRMAASLHQQQRRARSAMVIRLRAR
jgi:hypothetical protein